MTKEFDSDGEQKLHWERGWVGGSPGDGGGGGTTTERERGGGCCRGGKLRERAAAHSQERERECERGACGGYKEKEEQGLKLQELSESAICKLTKRHASLKL